MINQYTPQGSVVYQQRGTSSSGTPLWSQTVTLSPEQQAAYNRDVAMNAQLQGVASQGVNYVQSALSQPLTIPGVYNPQNASNFSVQQYQPATSTVSTAQPSVSSVAPSASLKPGVTQEMINAGNIEKMPTVNFPFETTQPTTTTPTTNAPTASGSTFTPSYAAQGVAPTQFVSAVNAPKLQTEMGDTGYIQRALNQPTVNLATGANAGRIQNRTFNNLGQIQTNAGSPELTQQDVTNAVYQQQTAMLDPQFQKSQARLENQLANQGITRGSEAWNNAMQEANMQKQQAYESARNSAIQQGVAAGSQMYQNQLAGMQAGNAALGQQFGQGLQGAQFANTAQQQAYQQSLANAQMQNQARAQQLQEALSTGQFANEAQAQSYQQELGRLQAENAAMAQQFGMGLTNAELYNQAANQRFAQGLTNAQLYNQALQQNFGIAQTLRQEPINILNAVRTGSQMQSAAQPQVGVSSPGQLATWSGPDLLGATTAQGQYNQGLYNAQQAASSNQMSGLMGLAGTGMMAGGMVAM
jgi:hypothetical protein